MMTQVLEWARENTHSTVWSCLAHHAAVLHMDGIPKAQETGDKHFGVFECARVTEHPLLAGAPPRFHIPHSRWNGVGAEETQARGLPRRSRAPRTETRTEIFDTVRERGQEPIRVLFRAIRSTSRHAAPRVSPDAERYLRQEASAHPGIPRGYLDHATERALAALREESHLWPGRRASHHIFATALKTSAIENTWRGTAERIYRTGWTQIRARKKREASAKIMRRIMPKWHIRVAARSCKTQASQEFPSMSPARAMFPQNQTEIALPELKLLINNRWQPASREKHLRPIPIPPPARKLCQVADG